MLGNLWDEYCCVSQSWVKLSMHNFEFFFFCVLRCCNRKGAVTDTFFHRQLGLNLSIDQQRYTSNCDALPTPSCISFEGEGLCVQVSVNT